MFLALVNVSFAADKVQADSGSDEKLKELDDKVQGMQKLIQSQNSISSSSGARLNSTTLAQLEEVKEHIRSLRGDLEQIQFDNARLNEKMVKIAADMEYRFNDLEKRILNQKDEAGVFSDLDEELDNDLILSESDVKAANEHRESKVNGSDDPLLAKKLQDKSMEDQFKDAQTLLKQKNYKEAKDAFTIVTEKYPNTDVAGNAHYWLGEIYYARSQFDKSAVEYLKGYQSSIRGSRAADNLLKLGISMSKLEKRKEACTTYAKLKKEFPKAPNTIRKQLEEEMKNIRCE
jgi:tol-pal system protein YbgF